MMKLLCIDIGNTSAHAGLVEGGVVTGRRDIPTSLITQADAGIRELVGDAADGADGIAFASVVPSATAGLWQILRSLDRQGATFQLRHDTVRGLGFDYPNPSEVGQDRIANVVAARELFGTPSVVIDMGTATTFDVLTSKGYAGGIIAPGLALMTDYLHEKTAQLPKLERMELLTGVAVGKSTVDAMRIGAGVGFRGMIREMLAAVLDELRQTEGEASVITTGGNAIVLAEGWWPGARNVPDLALFGLAIAYERSL
jgi:type III pantothenate kinase